MLIPAKQVATKGPVFVYQQGGTQDLSMGIYTTWAAAYAAAAAFGTLEPTILIDGSLGAPQITAGAWDLGGFTIKTSDEAANFTVDVLDGALFSFTRYDRVRFDGITFFWHHTTAPCISLTGVQNVWMEWENSAGINVGVATQPFFHTTSTGFQYLAFKFANLVEGNGLGGIGFVNAGAGTVEHVWGPGGGNGIFGGNSNISTNSFGGTGAHIVNLQTDDLSYTTTQPGSAITWNLAPQTIGTPIRLAAQNTSAQSIPDANVLTTWTGWTALVDTGPAGTNLVVGTGEWTCPIAGFYHISAQGEFSASTAAAASEISLGVYKNGAGGAQVQGVHEFDIATSNKRLVTVNVTLPFAKGDVVDLRWLQDLGAGPVALTAAALRNFWTIALVR